MGFEPITYRLKAYRASHCANRVGYKVRLILSDIGIYIFWAVDQSECLEATPLLNHTLPLLHSERRQDISRQYQEEIRKVVQPLLRRPHVLNPRHDKARQSDQRPHSRRLLSPDS